MIQKFALTLLALIAADAMAAERWVPPPAPQVVTGVAIRPEAEIDGSGGYILHLPKPEQTDWRQTRYRVEITRRGPEVFEAELMTRPFTRTDEVLFLRVMPGSEAEYELEIVDYGSRPFKRVFLGKLSAIPEIAD